MNKGKSEALNAGFKKCTGNIVITLDADLQDDPKEIEKFISKVKETGGLVSGWKKNRLDSFSKRIQSKIVFGSRLLRSTPWADALACRNICVTWRINGLVGRV